MRIGIAPCVHFIHLSYLHFEVSHSPYYFDCFANSLGENTCSFYLKRITCFTWLIAQIFPALSKYIFDHLHFISMLDYRYFFGIFNHLHSLVCLIFLYFMGLIKLMYMSSLSVLFIWRHCQYCLSGDIVSIIYLATLSVLFR